MTNILYRLVNDKNTEHLIPYYTKERELKERIARTLAQHYSALCDYSSQADYHGKFSEMDSPLND